MLSITHAKIATLPDEPGVEVNKAEWNDEHDLSGFGDAAEHPASDFATAAQGAKADSAVQPGDLGTAASHDATDFATAAQGAEADNAVQPGDLAAIAFTGSGADLVDKSIPYTKLKYWPLDVLGIQVFC